VYDGVYPTEDPFKELTGIEHTIDNYGDTLPSRRPVETAYFSFEQPDSSTQTSSFHKADTLRSFGNYTYDLEELPVDVIPNRNDEVKFTVYMRYVPLHPS